jgi:hypothetical protein
MMAGPISNREADRLLGTRLEHYRLAVQAGFYNEWPETIAYRGFHIVRDETGFHVLQNGSGFGLQFKQLHVAKVWVVCRTQNCGLIQAHAIVKAEKEKK